jgi:hypothetical protein
VTVVEAVVEEERADVAAVVLFEVAVVHSSVLGVVEVAGLELLVTCVSVGVASAEACWRTLAVGLLASEAASTLRLPYGLAVVAIALVAVVRRL